MEPLTPLDTLRQLKEMLDAGALTRARELEALGFLQLTLAAGSSIGWTGGFALVK